MDPIPFEQLNVGQKVRIEKGRTWFSSCLVPSVYTIKKFCGEWSFMVAEKGGVWGARNAEWYLFYPIEEPKESQCESCVALICPPSAIKPVTSCYAYVKALRTIEEPETSATHCYYCGGDLTTPTPLCYCDHCEPPSWREWQPWNKRAEKKEKYIDPVSLLAQQKPDAYHSLKKRFQVEEKKGSAHPSQICDYCGSSFVPENKRQSIYGTCPYCEARIGKPKEAHIPKEKKESSSFMFKNEADFYRQQEKRKMKTIKRLKFCAQIWLLGTLFWDIPSQVRTFKPIAVTLYLLVKPWVLLVARHIASAISWAEWSSEMQAAAATFALAGIMVTGIVMFSHGVFWPTALMRYLFKVDK